MSPGIITLMQDMLQPSAEELSRWLLAALPRALDDWTWAELRAAHGLQPPAWLLLRLRAGLSVFSKALAGWGASLLSRCAIVQAVHCPLPCRVCLSTCC